MNNDEYSPDFSKRLSELRALKSLTQKELADLAWVSQRQISAYESGKSWPRTAVLYRLAVTLGTTPEWLSKGVGSFEVNRQLYPNETNKRVPILTSELLFDWMTSLGDESIAPRVHLVSYEVSDLAFAMICNDDCMVAANDFGFGFPKGCLIIFEPLIEVEDQDFVLACMKGGKTSFRQFFSGFRTLKLMPLDNRYPGDVLTPDELGKNGVTLIVAIAMESSLPALSRSSSRLQKLIT